MDWAKYAREEKMSTKLDSVIYLRLRYSSEAAGLFKLWKSVKRDTSGSSSLLTVCCCFLPCLNGDISTFSPKQVTWQPNRWSKKLFLIKVMVTLIVFSMKHSETAEDSVRSVL